MISRANKFPTRLEFLSFRGRAKQSSSAHLRVFISPHQSSRLSVIIPKKVNKRATARNSFKRLVYDAVWKILKDKNLDCIIMFKPIALPKGKSFENLILSELQGHRFENLRI